MNIDLIIETAKQAATKVAVAETIYRMPPDSWHLRYIRKMFAGLSDHWFDLLTFLHAFSSIAQPQTYLEIGVRKGGSMSQVIKNSPRTVAYGFDQFPPDYAVVEGWKHIPSTPALVSEALAQFKPTTPPVFFTGDSRFTVPRFFKEHPGFTADLALVDGDHSEEGARRDLDIVFPCAKVVVFDDTIHPFHSYLERVFDEMVAKHGQGWKVVKDSFDVGTAVAFRP